MTDVVLAAFWVAVLAAALFFCLELRRRGVATTYVRDLLHVGAGVWPLGWPLWQTRAAPIALAFAGAVVTMAVPLFARRARVAALFHASVSNGEERWHSVALYGVTFTAFTVLGFLGPPYPAAAALLSLSLGDGIGGAFGRAFGRHLYRAPGAKRKSLEGSIVVAVCAAAGAAIAAMIWPVAAPLELALLAGVTASVSEAASPEGTDNALVPAAVWTVLCLSGGAP